MKLNRHSSLFKEGRMEQSLAEHQAIVDALIARQPELAAERMSAHFSNGLEAAS
jgi:DNA-binding GntR family transcriptional regulator